MVGSFYIGTHRINRDPGLSIKDKHPTLVYNQAKGMDANTMKQFIFCYLWWLFFIMVIVFNIERNKDDVILRQGPELDNTFTKETHKPLTVVKKSKFLT